MVLVEDWHVEKGDVQELSAPKEAPHYERGKMSYEQARAERTGEPLWKQFDCPTCDSKMGQSCGRIRRGDNWWERCAPHAARKRLAVVLETAKREER